VNDHKPIFSSSPTASANLDDEPVFTEDFYDPNGIRLLEDQTSNFTMTRMVIS